MTMMELFKAGYTVTCGSFLADTVIEDEDDVLAFEDDFELEEIDEDAKTAYFYHYEDWDAYGDDL